MTTNTMTINLDDANLPTTGKAWDAMLKHVMANCDVDDIIEEIKNRGNDIPLADLLDADCGDDAVVEYIHDAGITIDAIWDEGELREMDIIQQMLESEREGLMDDGWGKVAEKDDEIEELEKKVAELKEEIDEWGLMVDGLGFENADLERKVAKLTAQMRFLDPNGRPCDRCNEPVCYEGNEGKISENDGEIICGECYSREVEEAKHNEKYTLCESCRRNCYTGGEKYPDGYTCDDCEEDEEASDAETEDDE
jgi:hypothetical protein